MRCFGKIAHNGKRIGEVRASGELKVQERPSEADAFSILLTYKKIVELKSSGGKKGAIFNSEFHPAFCQYNMAVAQLRYSENSTKKPLIISVLKQERFPKK